MPGFSPDGLAVFGVAGRPPDDHRPPRPAARRRGPLHPHAAGDRLPGRRGGPHRPGRLSLLARGVQGAATPPPGRSPQRFGRQSWAFLPLTVAGPHDGRLDGGLRLSGRLHPRRAVRADDGGPHARPGPVPGRGRRVRAGADATACSARCCPTLGPRDPRHGGRRPLRTDRRRPPGRRRLVRHDPAARPRPVRPGHRRRPGPRRAGRRPDGPAADRPARLRLRGPPPRRGPLPRLPLPARHRPYGPTDERPRRPALRDLPVRRGRPRDRRSWTSPAPATPTRRSGWPTARC